MLQESFLWLPGIREKTEQQLWQSGINTWEDMLTTQSVPGISKERLIFWKNRIRLAKQLLDQDDNHNAIARLLGSRNIWRLYPHILDNPRFVDIETTEYANNITVVGVSDGDFYQGFIQGKNLDVNSLRRAFIGATCIITFNGSSFDLPIIEHAFPNALPKVPHIDLRHVCARAGLHGGLKRIEKHLAIKRPDTIRETDGTDAILLWYKYKLGDEKALNDLVDYNAADVLNLKPLAEKVIPALWKHTRHGEQLPFEACSSLRQV